MREVVPGYGLTKEELDLELGVGVDRDLVVRHSDLIISKQHEVQPSDKPSLLLLGGFQGSGKTTTLNILSEKRQFLTISQDEILYNLLAENYQGDFSAVTAIKFELMKKALEKKYSVVVEQSLSPDRIKLARQVLDTYSPEYPLLSVFLYAPIDQLRERVTKRSETKGRYKGTINELERATRMFNLRYGNPLDVHYDLVINTSENNPQSVVRQILDLYSIKGL